MQKLVKVFSFGLLISFLGSLPLGTMNIAATHIAIEQGTNAGLQYAVGSMLVELIVIRIVLVSMSWFAKHRKVFRFLEILTTGLLLLLATGSFIAAYKMTGFSGSLPVSKTVYPFWTGVLLSATNPLHIPFWMGWSTVLMNKQVLLPDEKNYTWYMTGIGTGTIFGFMVFIYGGFYMIVQISAHQSLLNGVIGMVLLATALLQIKKMMGLRPVEKVGA